MPNAPKTSIKGVRIPDDLWDAVKAQAASEGLSASDAVRLLLGAWVAGDVTLPPPAPREARR